MAITKVALLLVVVCGVLSIADAGDTGLSVRSSRKMLSGPWFWFWYCGSIADAESYCFALKDPQPHYWRRDTASCYTITNVKVYSWFAKADSDAVARAGGNVAYADATATAIGRCPRVSTETYTIVTGNSSESGSSSSASVGGPFPGK